MTPVLASTLSSSAALSLTRHASTLKSGKRAREEFMMRTTLPPLSASFSLSLSLSQKKAHFIVILRLECSVGHLAMWQGFWLSGWLAGSGVASTAKPGCGSHSRQHLRGERERQRAASCYVFAAWPRASEKPSYASVFSSAK